MDNDSNNKKRITIASPGIGKEEIRSVVSVLKSGNLSQGKIVKDFEEEFSSYIGTNYAAAISNGTDAIYLSLIALGIKEGDEVITTPFSFVASASAISRVGATPIFADVNNTYNIDSKLLEEKISKKTKAVIVVHLYGMPCEMNEILSIAKKRKLFVIEDACQAHGALYFGKKVGGIGDIGCFSFYATKNMTTGEGGMIVCRNKKIYDKVCVLRNQGMKKRYHHSIFGFNMRMSNIEAAIGIEQLKKLDNNNKLRQKNAYAYFKLLKGTTGIVLPIVPENVTHVFHQYTIRITNKYPLTRDRLREELSKNGIDTEIYYPLAINKQKIYKKKNVTMPIAESYSKQVLSLPVHPSVTKSDVFKICRIISFFQKKSRNNKD